jgi:hypothetical protein
MSTYSLRRPRRNSKQYLEIIIVVGAVLAVSPLTRLGNKSPIASVVMRWLVVMI